MTTILGTKPRFKNDLCQREQVPSKSRISSRARSACSSRWGQRSRRPSYPSGPLPKPQRQPTLPPPEPPDTGASRGAFRWPSERKATAMSEETSPGCARSLEPSSLGRKFPANRENNRENNRIPTKSHDHTAKKCFIIIYLVDFSLELKTGKIYSGLGISRNDNREEFGQLAAKQATWLFCTKRPSCRGRQKRGAVSIQLFCQLFFWLLGLTPNFISVILNVSPAARY